MVWFKVQLCLGFGCLQALLNTAPGESAGKWHLILSLLLCLWLVAHAVRRSWSAMPPLPGQWPYERSWSWHPVSIKVDRSSIFNQIVYFTGLFACKIHSSGRAGVEQVEIEEEKGIQVWGMLCWSWVRGEQEAGEPGRPVGSSCASWLQAGSWDCALCLGRCSGEEGNTDLQRSYVHLFVYINICVCSWRPETSVRIFCSLSPYILRRNLEFIHVARQSSKDLPVSTSQLWCYKSASVPGAFTGAWDLNSGPCIYRANLYPIEPSTQLYLFLLIKHRAEVS